MTAPGHSRRSDGSKALPNVRYAFNGDRICASQRTDAMCQFADIEPKGCLVDYVSIANRQAEIKTRPIGTQSGIFR